MATAKIEPESHPSEGLNIYQIIDRISNEAGALAPAQAGGVPFAFRGIDGTVAHLSPFLRKYGVVVVPQITERETDTVISGNKIMARTKLVTDFTFYAPDGTFLVATTAGEATDYADRSTAQAQSVAFRVALLQTFFLPTHSPEPEQTGVEGEAPAQQTYAAPAAVNSDAEKIQKARGMVKAIAEKKGVEYLQVARDIELPADYAGSLTELKKLHDHIAKLPDAEGSE